MTILGRTIVRVTGFVGEPGFNILHWSAGAGAGPTAPGGVEEFHDTLEAGYSALADYYNNQQTISIESQVAYFDDADGILLGTTTDPSGQRDIDCTSTAFNVDRALCATLRLRTDEYVDGRRLQGRIFLGPAAANLLDGAGQVASGANYQVRIAFEGAISGLGGRLAVWHRPKYTTADPPVLVSAGSYGDVTSFICNTTPGTLRSRKT